MSSPATFIIEHSFPQEKIEVQWRACLSRAECPAHYDAPEFFREPYWQGKHPFAILAIRDEVVTGILTGTHEEGETLCGLMSRPQACIAADARHDQAVQALADGLIQEAGAEKTITVHAWEHSPLSALERYGFRQRRMEGDVVLDLSLGPDALFQQFHENRRRNIRLAIRKGVEVAEAASEEDMADFYQVYTRWRHTERKQIHHDVAFEVFLERFRNPVNYRFFLARYGGKTIAGVNIRAYPGGLVEFANNSSLDEFLHLRPNDLIQWRIIQWACASGFRRYSLGGAHPFLRRFGGTIVPIHRYRLDRTFLHRRELREKFLENGRIIVKKLPKPVEMGIRRLMRKTA